MFRPAKPVEVLADGVWHRGELEACRADAPAKEWRFPCESRHNPPPPDHAAAERSTPGVDGVKRSAGNVPGIVSVSVALADGAVELLDDVLNMRS
jgi:hypothetical protein